MSEKIDCFKALGEAVGRMAIKLAKDHELNVLLVDMSDNPSDSQNIENLNFDFVNGRVRTVPNVDLTTIKEATVVIVPTYGTVQSNFDFSLIGFDIDIFVPIDKWQVNLPIQRPYGIMSCIKRLLDNSRVSGIGVLRFTNFELDLINSEVSLHTMKFIVDVNS